ncbi:RluA family pseudouridine synthase [Ruixingdingia sedimenti]|uniref:Pseudouridine synthase n=1 Tax=Ruixingdingia sedimenti TaxID=3073604 RepID=A0ABU1F6C6_9RHOB|nr:RluA family pseudouridine synthase [Xinfangfangia sp. LG-4]MDR5652416.1 RluA family pseudouridine synthase [Xinfangfangia sp. LG-4]
MIEFSYDPPDVPLSVLYRDDDILVADKPAGLLSVPGKLPGRDDCLIARLAAEYPRVLLVHRLDCDTSGVMVFALHKPAQGALGKQFERREVEKTYLARLWGRLSPATGRVDLPLCADWPNRPRQMVSHDHGRAAQTDWEVLAQTDTETRTRLRPLTGRSHQLRVHMAELGHPILGDPIYATGPARAFPRLMLHAESLRLRHPGTGQMMTFTAPCPF